MFHLPKYLISFAALHIMATYQDKIIIITAPSGAGKTFITRHLLKTFPQMAFSISAATRQARSYEKDGVDYYFLALDDFKQKIRTMNS
ncbi:MAG: hypothetical protein WDN26_08110 [Chitinophagaceae bacterium]